MPVVESWGLTPVVESLAESWGFMQVVESLVESWGFRTLLRVGALRPWLRVWL